MADRLPDSPMDRLRSKDLQVAANPVDRLRSLRRGSTPGPWHVAGVTDVDSAVLIDGERAAVTENGCHGCGGIRGERNAAFIVGAENHWDRLLDVVEAAAALDAFIDAAHPEWRFLSDMHGLIPGRLSRALAALEAGAGQEEAG